MREIGRIDRVTKLLEQVWKEYPDFRFWQLITYVFEVATPSELILDPFFWEDDVWENMLKGILARGEDDKFDNCS